MNILVTGAKGFVGRNLVENLKNIRDGKNRIRPNIIIHNIYEFDKDNSLEELDRYCRDCNFVFNLAGVNRPKDDSEFQEGNINFAQILLDKLNEYNNKSTIMLSSSIQASLCGRFADSEYGRTKKEAEELFFKYSQETGAKVLIYRFPNVVGKWIKPNYNSAVGTFCHNIANELPVTVNDPNIELELLFIDDLINEMFDALEGKEHRCEYIGLETVFCKNGKYCAVPVTHKATLGRIVELLYKFHDLPSTLVIPEIAPGSFEKKLNSMYVSYLPKEKVAFPLKMNIDDRGSFTEILKTINCGQFSVNITKPGVTKGQHWHNSKWELFIVVSGHGLIEERKIGSDEVLRFEVSGEKLEVVHMLPGYTHKLVNLSETENLVTLMWANEQFDSNNPDTFFENV